MHLVFRESHGLEEQSVPQDLGQRPGDVVVLSFSDSDISAFAAGWRAGGFPWSLRLANLAALVHPLSVDTYVEQTLVHAKAILIRLIGGAAYWEYGLREVERLARERGIALVVLAADGREDRRLMVASTVGEAVVRRRRFWRWKNLRQPHRLGLLPLPNPSPCRERGFSPERSPQARPSRKREGMGEGRLRK